MRAKNGMTLIEIIVVIAIIAILSTFGWIGFGNYKEKQAINNIRDNMPVFLTKMINSSFETGKRYGLEFDFINKEIKKIELEEKKIKDIFVLEKELSYIKKEGESKFTREVTENGNFNIGFTIFIKSKDSKKTFLKIVGDSTNPIQVAMIKTYKPKGKAYLDSKVNLENKDLWEKIK